ncbi:MAG: flagellar motor protein MotB [Limnobacter sp.]|jgi:chemotaxis protein MotB|uniref:Flagellar motor protein MotB n=1 Tax=Limnobacter profundi TaxID=2732163 RepID=A0ABX6N3V8_9BURK|nr:MULTISPECIES: flagellar motor protein MotB [unclassified Limnobacter]PZO11794.1 MAG: motility protein MotB [Betaproteobacteria bacterium]PZO20677.1 MAG: motility protein MotB [Betaproteobacteria bacterium]PZO25360.1 MAG: motility protein MotB [Betaproteobacteria bacterium]QJR29080.1 flagellar motor protein MotB [Limnobacter sp. SAORIC-580]
MAKSDEERPIIVVKKIKKGGHGHHGGAWKIAYADFVTAMMAFFLLMWLLGSTSEGDLKGISDYFNSPLKVALVGGPGSGTATSVIDAGGTDLSRSVGQIKSGSTDKATNSSTSDATAEALERAESKRLLELKGEIEGLIDASDLMKQFKNQIMLDITPEGLRIQIVDERNRPMFDSGSAVLKDYMKDILRNLTKLLNQVPNKLTLSGHTDATPYAAGNKGYSNWELSADRANASRREMYTAGMPDQKILRVVGLASSVSLDEKDPYAAVNRRIAIVVMNKRAEEAVRALANLDDGQDPGLIELPPVPKVEGLPFPKNGPSTN